MADNLGWGELGCYGGGALRGAPTPRIDALAKEGIMLHNYNVEVSASLLIHTHVQSYPAALPYYGYMRVVTRDWRAELIVP
jgi:hypothetical protein